MVEIKKRSGGREPFSRDKIIRAVHRAGGDQNIAEQIATQVELELHRAGVSSIGAIVVRDRVQGLLRRKAPATAISYAFWAKPRKHKAIKPVRKAAKPKAKKSKRVKTRARR